MKKRILIFIAVISLIFNFTQDTSLEGKAESIPPQPTSIKIDI